MSIRKTWALVLAAGDGSRLHGLTTGSNGVAVPKQFCSLQGGPSLLQDALSRASTVAPQGRVTAIVAAQHRPWWEGLLGSLAQRNIIVQPRNRGTAIGILLPLLHIAARDPEARVVLLPSDHHVLDEQTLARALRVAALRAVGRPDQIQILGVTPEEPDCELGYLVPGALDAEGARHVAQFVEKPSPDHTRQLLGQGAVWNAFILAGSVANFLRLFEARCPDIAREMRDVVLQDARAPGAGVAVARLYERLPDVDFSRHVLEGQEERLRLVVVGACGWSDLGTPRRVASTLGRLPPLSLRQATPVLAPGYLNLAAQHELLQSSF
jgi:mannose-1-phosphate guanylyltransferase